MKHQNQKNGLLADFSKKEAKKTAARATMEKKGKVYHTIINISVITLCSTSVITMIGTIISLLTSHLPIDYITPATTIVLIVMATSMLTLLIALIAKKIWRWKLLKLGIDIPIELD